MFVICKDSKALVNLDRCAMVEIEGGCVFACDTLPRREEVYGSYKLLGSYGTEENAKCAFRDLVDALDKKWDVFQMPAMP